MPNQPDPNTVSTSFTLPQQLLELVENKAKEELTNKSDIIRRALMNYLTPAERTQILNALAERGIAYNENNRQGDTKNFYRVAPSSGGQTVKYTKPKKKNRRTRNS